MKRKYNDNEYDTLTNEYVSSKSIRNITNIRTLTRQLTRKMRKENIKACQ